MIFIDLDQGLRRADQSRDRIVPLPVAALGVDQTNTLMTTRIYAKHPAEERTNRPTE